MKSNEKQQSNIEELLKLIQENPNLRIVPMVDSEIVFDEGYSYWMGSWGSAEIDEVYFLDERIYFRSDDEDEIFDNKADQIFDDEYPNQPYLSDEESKVVEMRAEKYVKELPWEKVIAVRINTP